VDIVALNRIASRQRGLFTRRQARACGLSPFQLRHRVRSGVWRRVSPSVFAPATLTMTAKVRDRAVQLATPGSVLAGPSAARCWDIPVPDTRPCLLVAPHAHPRVDALVIYGRVDASELWVRDGAPVTSRPRTVVDCLRLLPDADALTLLERALQQHWIDMEELTRRVRSLVGHRGAPRLVRLVSKVADGSRSAAERRMIKLLGGAGFVGWVVNAPISDRHGVIGVGDVVFPDERVVIEVDGWAFHVAPDRFQRDRARQNRLVAAGWTVLRFTWRDLTDRPAYVVATITAVLTA
jgi:hypothetical protein